MRAAGAILAGCFACASAPALAESCLAGSTDSKGEPRYSPVTIDFAGESRLDPAALPEGASAVMCRRRSIVPRPDDVRVLSEWHIAFGILDEAGRALWVSALEGRLRVTVEGGKLNQAEKEAVRQWLDPANIRFVLEWDPR